MCMAIGGWGDDEGFGTGAATDESRKTFAKNVAETVEKLGYDCVGEWPLSDLVVILINMPADCAGRRRLGVSWRQR